MIYIDENNLTVDYTWKKCDDWCAVRCARHKQTNIHMNVNVQPIRSEIIRFRGKFMIHIIRYLYNIRQSTVDTHSVTVVDLYEMKNYVE